MSHEQSETIQRPDGRWINVYGKNLFAAGQQLPGSSDYATVDEAVAAAEKRSAGFDMNLNQDNELFPRSAPDASHELISSRSDTFDELGLRGDFKNPPLTPIQPPPNQALNLAPPQAPAAQPKETDIANKPLPDDVKALTVEPKKQSATKEFLSSLSTRERFALTLQEVGSALQGKVGPLRGMVESERKFKQDQLAENRAAVETIGKGLSFVRGLPPGPQRDAAIEAFSVAIPGNLQESFRSFAKRDDVLSNYSLIDGDKRVKAVAHGICSTSGDYGKCMTEFITDNSKAKALAKAVDDPALPDIEKKLSAISTLPEVKAELERMADAGKFPTLFDLFDKQKKILPPELQLTRDDFLTLRRNQDILPKYGLYTDEIIKKQVEEKLKTKTKEGEPEEQVKKRRAQIQLKIDRGEAISERERTFLDELNKADPIIQLRREILGGAETRPIRRLKLGKEGALKKLLKDNPGFTKDSPEIKDALKQAGF